MSARFRHGDHLAENAFSATAWPTGEVQGIGVAQADAISERQPLQALDRHGRTIGRSQVIDRRARRRIEGDDRSVARISYKQQVARQTIIRGRQGQTIRRVQQAVVVPGANQFAGWRVFRQSP